MVSAMDFGQLRAGSSVVTETPLWWRMLVMTEGTYACVGHMGDLCTLLLILL